jgi:hypothetical protein
MSGPRVIKFSEIKPGDLIRVNQKRYDATVTVEGVVAKVEEGWAFTGGGYALVSETHWGVTIELLDRPVRPVRVGDVLATAEDYARCPVGTVAANKGTAIVKTDEIRWRTTDSDDRTVNGATAVNVFRGVRVLRVGDGEAES